MRIKAIKNAKIEAQMSNVGQKVEPLSDEEYDLLEKMIKKNKVEAVSHKFDENFVWFVAKIPQNKSPEERIMPSGDSMYSCSFILSDGSWTSVLLPEGEEEIDVFASHNGENVAIVGKLIPDKTGKFINIRAYRGCILLSDDEDEDDDDEEF